MSPQVHWKLPRLLEKEGISVYRLDQELTKRVSRATLYKWSSLAGPQQLDLKVLGWVLWGLERITGKSYTIHDIVEVTLDVHGDISS